MKFSAVLLVAAAAAVSAQSIADIPACAQGCLITALGTTGCDVTDLKCSCGNEKFVNDGAACIDKTCGDDDIKKARAATIALCGKAGVTINPPQKGGDAPAPASSSAAAAAPAPSSEAPAPVSSSEAAPAPVSSAPATSSAAVVAPGYGGVTTSTTSRVAAPSVAPPSGNGTVSQPPAPIQTGAAAAIAGNALLALGGAVAAFFL